MQLFSSPLPHVRLSTCRAERPNRHHTLANPVRADLKGKVHWADPELNPRPAISSLPQRYRSEGLFLFAEPASVTLATSSGRRDSLSCNPAQSKSLPEPALTLLDSNDERRTLKNEGELWSSGSVRSNPR
jgi:hypothetical protein